MSLTSNQIKNIKWKALIFLSFILIYPGSMMVINTWWFHTNSASQTSTVVIVGYFLIRTVIHLEEYISRKYHG